MSNGGKGRLFKASNEEFRNLSRHYSSSILVSIVAQAVAIGLGAEYNQTFPYHLFFWSFCAYWPLALLLIMLRPNNPPNILRLFVMIGFIGIYLALFWVESTV